MGELKQAIVGIVNGYCVISDEELEIRLSQTFLSTKQSERVRAISELVQANEIRRYEYILSNEHTRRSFYMPLGSRLMI